MLRCWIIGIALVSLARPLCAEDWPAWRGPLGNGYSSDTGFPLRWSNSHNVKWKTRLPGPGNSTPIVTGPRVFVTCASEDGHRRSLICIDRETGRHLWQQHVDYTSTETTHKTNPPCSASPVTDGRRVIAWYGSAGVHAYDIDGSVLWTKDLGVFKHIWGTGSSPILYKDLVILNCGPGLHAFLVALDKTSGKEIWRREFPEMNSEEIGEYRGSWSTPTLDSSGDRDLLLVSLPLHLDAIDPLTGDKIWSAGGLGKLVYTTPLISAKAVVAMSGYYGPAIAVKPGGRGDVTRSHRLWIHDQKNPQRVGSGIIVGDSIYVLNEPGIAWCIDLLTGEILWKQRLSKAASWNSICYADGLLYVGDKEGTTYVFRPDPSDCTVLAENRLDEPMNASFALADGQVFARTLEHLFCIESATEKRPQEPELPRIKRIDADAADPGP